MFANRSDFGLPVKSWLTKEDAVVGLLLSSFVINCLGLVFPVCVLQFYDRVIPNQSTGTLAVMVLLILGAFTFETILKVLRAYISSWSSARFTYNMGKELFQKVMYTDLAQFERNTAGLYLDKFNSAESIREYYCGQNLILLVDVPFIVVYLGLMIFINPYMAMIPAIISVFLIVSTITHGHKTFKHLENKNEMSEVKSKFLIEMISGIHTIKSLGMEEQFMRRYERLHQREITSNYDLIQRLAKNNRAGNFYSQLAVILTVTLGGVFVINHDVTVGGLAATILLTGKLMLPVTKLATYLEKKKNLNIAKNDLEFILNFQPEYKNGLRKLDNFQGEIKLENFAFKYPGTEHNIFDSANFHVKAKETIVIHGETFSGKSTLLLLLINLYKIDEGSMSVDGIDIHDIDLENYRRQVAYMNDDGELFNGTIIDNLTLFEKDKYTVQAKQIARAIGLHDIIEAMPNAYNTEVGTGTIDLLSKGHKQQILLVRSLIGDPKVILFDEANLALDIESDVKLRKYLMSKKGKCTIILVTHRPSLLEMADRHLKIENGTLVEFKWK